MPEAGRGFQLLAPRNLAASGPDEHVRALGLMAVAGGWTVTSSQGTLVLLSRCRRIGIGYEPKGSESGEPMVLASVRASRKGAERWHARVAGHAPAELLTALIASLQHELVRDPDALIYGVGEGEADLSLSYEPEAWEVRSPAPGDDFTFALLSSDGTVAVSAHAIPDRPGDSSGDPKWLAVAATAPDRMLWCLSLSRNTPAHFAAHLVNHILDNDPVLRPTTQDPGEAAGASRTDAVEKPGGAHA
ncbi:DUF317 domain-containing protein [Streptacidiphilus fuscans]|uniref:DUF317 domain-containing protein n=1 Tax=Streptacidiphilus fuscans TaxID=2789292 RepID=A0A931BE35_9ACTN|nr:DUF317 domain-containing protein [Streptacidiphilus fuscans]MBF9071760.1 DUF317 domain-containing protein [Streptacidiphilus fuscans]